jgi:hypothetical protein
MHINNVRKVKRGEEYSINEYLFRNDGAESRLLEFRILTMNKKGVRLLNCGEQTDDFYEWKELNQMYKQR